LSLKPGVTVAQVKPKDQLEGTLFKLRRDPEKVEPFLLD
jgi:hypothetical protein